MRFLNFFRDLNLSIKLNFMILLSSLAFLLILAISVSRIFDRVILAVGGQRSEQEGELIQERFERRQEELLLSARLLAATPGLADAVIENEITDLQTTLQAGVNNLGFDVATIVDAAGLPIASYSPDDQMFMLPNSEMLYALSISGEETAALVTDDANTNGHAVSIAAVTPLPDASGHLIGGLIVGRAVDDQLLADINLHRSDVHLLLADASNIVAQHVAHSDVIHQHMEAEAGTQEQHEAGSMSDHDMSSDEQPMTHTQSDDATGADGSQNHQEQALVDIDDNAVHQALAGESSILSTRLGNQPHAIAYLPFHHDGDQPLAMIVLVSLEDLALFNSQMLDGVRLIILGLMVALILAVGLYAHFNITRPLKKLSVISTQMAAGDYAQRVGFRTRDEVGRLGTAFNQMAAAIQKHAQELQELNASLEQRVEERTAELQSTNEALAQARDQALEASKLKTQLLANVSHDLRTPLNAILGYTELFQLGTYGAISEQQQDIIIKMMKSTQKLLEFVNNLLNQARIEADKVQIKPAPFSPERLVNGVIGVLQVLAHLKGIALTTDIAPDIPEKLIGDKGWLHQILLNLTSNAIKFTDRGAVNIRIYRPDRDAWALEVSDTGSGIPEAAQAYIFDAFRQVDGSITRRHTGTGLGLSIVKELALLMDGEVSVRSQPGSGSTFTVTFPMIAEGEQVGDKPVSVSD